MPEDTEQQQTPDSIGENASGPPLILWIAIGMVVVIGAVSAFLFLGSKPEAVLLPPPTQEDIAYGEQLQLSELHLSAEENFLNQQITYLDGQITNKGQKTVQQLTMRLLFRDYYGQVILQQDQPILPESSEPLIPGQTRQFQLRFDYIPQTWNRQIPEFTLLSIRAQ